MASDEVEARTLAETLCCVSIRSRDSISEWMLLDDRKDTPPSLMQRVLCQCSPEARVPSGVEKIPEISALAGASLQRGQHLTAGSVQTLKWATFDSDTRVAQVEVFGGFGGKSHHAQWTEPVNKKWFCLINLGRLCDYTYEFRFREDWRQADIYIKGNLGLCCCTAWFAIPEKCVKFEMVQAEDSTDGSHWYRNSSKCGAELSKSYDIVQVLKIDGTEGRYYSDLAVHAPEQMLISR